MQRALSQTVSYVIPAKKCQEMSKYRSLDASLCYVPCKIDVG